MDARIVLFRRRHELLHKVTGASEAFSLEQGDLVSCAAQGQAAEPQEGRHSQAP